MNCQDFRELIDSYLSDELLTETNHDVLRHMENCANCRSVIKTRREVRERLKSAVINSPQYQIGRNFTLNLQNYLRDEALSRNTAKSAARFGFKPVFVFAAGLVLTFMLGLFLLSNLGDSSSTEFAQNSHTIPNLAANRLTNTALGDHEFCAVEHKENEPVSLARTPARYAKFDSVVMSPLKNVVSECELIDSHTCRYKNTNFTHLIIKNQGKLLSVMITDLDGAEKLSKQEEEDILYLSTDKYQIARFDLDNEAVFIISNFNRHMNSQAAEAIFKPLRERFTKKGTFETAKAFYLTFY